MAKGHILNAVFLVLSTATIMGFALPALDRTTKELSSEKHTELVNLIAEVVDVLFNNHIQRNCSEPSVPGKWIFNRTALPDVRVVDNKVHFRASTVLEDAKVMREVKRHHPEDPDLEDCYLALVELDSARVKFQGFVETTEEGCFVKATSAKLLYPFSWKIRKLQSTSFSENENEKPIEEVMHEIEVLMNKPYHLRKFADDFGPKNGPVVFDCTEGLRNFQL